MMVAGTAAVQRSPRDFRVYLTGQTLSSVGSGCTAFAFPVLAFRLTGSPLVLGMTTVLTYLPYALVGLPIGALVDRLNRRRILVWSDVGRAGVVALVPLLHGLHMLSVGLLLAVVAVHATLRIAFEAAQFAVIPQLAPQHQLQRANGQAQASYNAGAILGPSLAGAVTAITDISVVLLLDAASFLVSAATIIAIRTDLDGTREPRRLWASVREGLALVWRTPVLRAATAVAVAVNVLSGPYWAQLVYLAKIRYHASDAAVGQVFAAASLGVVLAGLAAGRLGRRYSFIVLTATALIGMGISITVMSLTRSLVVGMAGALAVRAFAVLFAVNTNTLRQQTVPPHMLGRVITVAMVCAWSAQPIGAAAGSLIVSRTGGLVPVIAVSGLLVAAVGVLLPRTALGRVNRGDRTPAAGASYGEPERDDRAGE